MKRVDEERRKKFDNHNNNDRTRWISGCRKAVDAPVTRSMTGMQP
ncbi:hypothetical protein D083_3979 [Dickeya solani RNS 08.23.3.1.A]|nr:hypothetical protein D083_3979 [Dickeya solani RNS 08.23.3.1.A]